MFQSIVVMAPSCWPVFRYSAFFFIGRQPTNNQNCYSRGRDKEPRWPFDIVSRSSATDVMVPSNDHVFSSWSGSRFPWFRIGFYRVGWTIFSQSVSIRFEVDCHSIQVAVLYTGRFRLFAESTMSILLTYVHAITLINIHFGVQGMKSEQNTALR